MGIDIVHVRPEHIALFDRVDEDVFDGPVVPERLSSFLADPAHVMVVALSEGIIVGQAAGVILRHIDLPTELYIDNLGVAPPFQRRHVATRMLERLFALGRERGCAGAWVGTEHDNDPANTLYSRYAERDDFALYAWPL